MLLRQSTSQELADVALTLKTKFDSLDERDKLIYAHLGHQAMMQENYRVSNSLDLLDKNTGKATYLTVNEAICEGLNYRNLVSYEANKFSLDDCSKVAYEYSFSNNISSATHLLKANSIKQSFVNTDGIPTSQDVCEGKKYFSTYFRWKRGIEYDTYAGLLAPLLHPSLKDPFDDFWKNDAYLTSTLVDLDQAPSLDLRCYVRCLNAVNTVLRTMRRFNGDMYRKYKKKAKESGYKDLTPFNFWGEYNVFEESAARFCHLMKQSSYEASKLATREMIKDLDATLGPTLASKVYQLTRAWANSEDDLPNMKKLVNLLLQVRLSKLATGPSTPHLALQLSSYVNRTLQSAQALRSTRVSGASKSVYRHMRDMYLSAKLRTGIRGVASLLPDYEEDRLRDLDSQGVQETRRMLTMYVAPQILTSAAPFLSVTLPNKLNTEPNPLGVFSTSDIWSNYDRFYQTFGVRSYAELPRKTIKELAFMVKGNGTITTPLAEFEDQLNIYFKMSKSKLSDFLYTGGGYGKIREREQLLEVTSYRTMVDLKGLCGNSIVNTILGTTPKVIRDMEDEFEEDGSLYEVSYPMAAGVRAALQKPTFFATHLLGIGQNIFLPYTLCRSSVRQKSALFDFDHTEASRVEHAHAPELVMDNGGYHGILRGEDNPVDFLLTTNLASVPVAGLISNTDGSRIYHVTAPSELRNMLASLSTLRQVCEFSGKVMQDYLAWFGENFSGPEYVHDLQRCARIVAMLRKYGEDAPYEEVVNTVKKGIEPLDESLDF